MLQSKSESKAPQSKAASSSAPDAAPTASTRDASSTATPSLKVPSSAMGNDDAERRWQIAAGEGVLFSADYSRAWRSKKQMPQDEISLEEAKEILAELGLPIPEEVLDK